MRLILAATAIVVGFGLMFLGLAKIVVVEAKPSPEPTVQAPKQSQAELDLVSYRHMIHPVDMPNGDTCYILQYLSPYSSDNKISCVR